MGRLLQLVVPHVPQCAHIGSSVGDECLPTVAMEGPHGLLHRCEPWLLDAACEEIDLIASGSHPSLRLDAALSMS